MAKVRITIAPTDTSKAQIEAAVNATKNLSAAIEATRYAFKVFNDAVNAMDIKLETKTEDDEVNPWHKYGESADGAFWRCGYCRKTYTFSILDNPDKEKRKCVCREEGTLDH